MHSDTTGITMRLAACGLVRTRFVGRADLERAAERDPVALARLEARLGLATAEDVLRAELLALHALAERNARAESEQTGPIARAKARFGAIEHLALGRGTWCGGCTPTCSACQDASVLLGFSRRIHSVASVPSVAQVRNADLHVSPTTRLSWPPAAEPKALGERLCAYKAARAAERREAARKAIDPVLRRSYEACGYRGCNAGHTTRVEIADAVSVAASKGPDWTKYKESKGKYGYPEQVSTHLIRVRADWIERVASHAAQTADGHVVLDLDITTGRATWIVQGRGVSLETQEGWLVRVGEAWHCATSERARKRLLVAGVVEHVRTGAEEAAS